MATSDKQQAFDWIDQNRQNLSDWHQIIWHLAEPAWREYKSCAWYVNKLREEGFEVEEGSGGGSGGDKWIPPLLPKDFKAPVHYPWPEYVATVRGEDWMVPDCEDY